MVFKCGESSDSEEERHDRFRNERSNAAEIKLKLNTFADRGSSRNEVSSRPRLCALCDKSTSSCQCSKFNRRDSPRGTPSRERTKESDTFDDRYYSRKRRSPAEDYRSYKRRSNEKESRTADSGDSSLKRKTESGVSSKSSHQADLSSKSDDPISAHHREKRCKKKMRKEKLKEEEELRKKHSKDETIRREVDGSHQDVNMDQRYTEGHRDRTDSVHRSESLPDSGQTKKDRHKSKLDIPKEKSDYSTDKSVRNHHHGIESTSYKREKDRCLTDCDSKKRREDSKDPFESVSLSSDDRIKSKDSINNTFKSSDGDKIKHRNDSEHNRDNQTSRHESKERKDVKRGGSEDVDKRRRKHSETRVLRKSGHRSNSDSTGETSKDFSRRLSDAVPCSDGEERHLSDCGSDSASYGPTLPPVINSRGKDRNERDIPGVSLPSERRTSVEDGDARRGDVSCRQSQEHTYGPSLPPSVPADDQSSSSTYGPKLPEQRTYGPTLPPSTSRSEGSKRVGPSLPDDISVDDDDDAFGPLPEGSSLTHSQILLQHRANLLRMHSSHKVDKKEAKREEWMLELPSKHRSGLGTVVPARSFKSKVTDAQIDPSWTDSPAKKLRKKELAQIEGTRDESRRDDLERVVSETRDKLMDKMVKTSKKKSSSKSLLELHQDKLIKKKKKEKKEGKKEERRPFSRETDLSTSRLTQAQKHSIFKKAHELDSRFSSGRAKYL